MDDSLRRGARTARAEIESGALRGGALLQRLLSVPFLERDAWLDALLGIEELPEDEPALPRESVAYLPAGAEEIVAALHEVPVRAEDELVDLGSGLGRVVILAHLLTGARARGVEIQAPLVQRARAIAEGLSLSGVSFVHADATEVELEGTVFFLYAPFNGEMMARAVRRLEAVARRRPIVVCAVGVEFPEVPWLLRRERSSVPALCLYDSRAEG